MTARRAYSHICPLHAQSTPVENQKKSVTQYRLLYVGLLLGLTGARYRTC